MAIVVVANAKGGSGKSTAALILACELSDWTRVTLIDADPNQPITTWAGMGRVPKNMTVVTNTEARDILEQIDAAASATPFVVVDLEGIASSRITYAASRADLVIVPMQESKPDGDMSAKVIAEIATLSSTFRRPIPFVVLLTRTKVVAKSRTARLVGGEIRAHPQLRVLQTEINERDAFAALWTHGCAVRDLNGLEVNNVAAAINNAHAYTAEVIELLMGLGHGKAAA